MGRNAGRNLERVWEASAFAAPESDHELRGAPLPPALAARFRGSLSIPLAHRPTLVANFVATLDGAVAAPPGRPGKGGGEVSGFSDTDRLMMALLRGLADAVLIGAGTLRAGHRHVWTAQFIEPGLADAFAAWRSAMGLAPNPTTVVVTGTGDIDPAHAALNDPAVPAVVVTTAGGGHRLERLPLARHVRVMVMPSDPADGTALRPEMILGGAAGPGTRLVLCEGGPTLFGKLVAAGLVDELFLTLAPQLFGRSDQARPPALVEGVDLAGLDRWAELRSIRLAGDDVYLRYRFRR